MISLILDFTPPTWSEDPRNYVECKNEISWNAWNYTQDYMRFGIEVKEYSTNNSNMKIPQHFH